MLITLRAERVNEPYQETSTIFGGNPVPRYRKLPFISPGPIQLRKAFWVGL